MENRILLLRINERCNANCFMCDFANNNSTNSISKNMFDSILNQITNTSYRLVRLTGGEPLLHDYVHRMVLKLNSSGYMTSIITNGLLLKKKYHNLCDAGLNQLIISLDGSKANIHDKIRNTNGLFDNIIEGIKLIKKEYPKVIIRVNTVVSPYNFEDIIDMYSLLLELDINQWSIIPIKTSKNLWVKTDKERFMEIYHKFQNLSISKSKLKILGFSSQWAGRNIDEINNYLNNNISFTPKGKCDLVKKVSFYNPFTDELTPCNCVAHRTEELKRKLSCIDQGGMYCSEVIKNKMTDWLNIYGPSYCKTCEPINVYLSENPEIIDRDIFMF